MEDSWKHTVTSMQYEFYINQYSAISRSNLIEQKRYYTFSGSAVILQIRSFVYHTKNKICEPHVDIQIVGTHNSFTVIQQ